MDPTILIGIGTIIVGGMQAAIYWQQKKAQIQANRQALFDRRYRLYKTFHWNVSNYVEVDGRYLKHDLANVLNDAVQESEFIFPAETFRQFGLIRDILLRHARAMPLGEYDPIKDETPWPDTPESIKAMKQLKAAFNELPAHLAVMRLTR